MVEMAEQHFVTVNPFRCMNHVGSKSFCIKNNEDKCAILCAKWVVRSWI